MAPFAGKREIQFIAIYIVIMIFLGLSKETTQFIFSAMGDQVYKTINFYFLSAIALMVTVSWIAQSHNIPSVPRVPPLYVVMINFIIFFPLFYIIFNFFFTGAVTLKIPTLAMFIIETTISFNENFIAFILLPALIPWGNGVGSIGKGTIINIGRGYSLSYDIPNFNRLKYGLPSISLISLLHVGTYSQNVSSYSQLYTVLLIAFVMFTFMYLVKETFGFGASEASHDAWNLSLIHFRGAVI